MSKIGKEYKLMVRIAGEVDKTYTSAMKKVKKEAEEAKKKIKQMTADETFSVMDNGFNKIESIGKKALSTIKRTAELAAAAVAGIGVAATNAGSEFEAAMSTVEAISGADKSQMEELTEKARELSRESIYSGTEVADAMQYMGMAGWRTEQILAGIEPVLNLATASGEDFALVSDIVTDNLTAFNMTAEEAGRMADVMAAAAMNSNTNVAKMGETFKYAGSVAGALDFSIEDVAIATGLMASSGVKASMAGTALRNIFTRMVKPTKDAQKAMDALGISIEEIDPETGEKKIKSLMKLMLQMRESVSGKSQKEIEQMVAGLAGSDLSQMSAEERKYYESLSEDELDALVLAEKLTDAEKEQYKAMSQTEKAYYAAGLAGQRGMTGLLTILNASDEDFKKLTEAIYGSEGAAEYMAKVKTDNLKGDVAILKNNINDAEVELYDTFKDTLREKVQGITEFVRDNIKNIPKWVDEISAHMATLKRKAGKYLEPVFELIVGTGKWLIKNKSGVIGVIAGIGSTLAAYKIASNTSHIVTGVKEFLAVASPTALAITGITVAIGGIVGAITAYKLHKQELIDNDLAEHFGNIQLSMEELNAAAHAIVDSGNMAELKRQMDAFKDLEQLGDNIQSEVDKISKIQWKIELGFELSEEEQKEVRTAAEESGKLYNQFAEDTAYNVAQLFPGEDAISKKVRDFYTKNVDKMHKLGEELARVVNDAYSGDLLDTDKLGDILDVQAQMAEVQKAISLGQQEAQFALLGQKYGGAALKPKAFENLQAEVNKVLEENEEIYNEAYTKKYAALLAAYGGDSSNKEFKEAVETLNAELQQNKFEQKQRAVEFTLDTIKNTYGNKIDSFVSAREEGVKAFFDDIHGKEASYLSDFKKNDQIIDTRLNDILNRIKGVSGIEWTQVNAVKELVEQTKTQINELMELANIPGLDDKKRQELLAQVGILKQQISEIMATGFIMEGDSNPGGAAFIAEELDNLIASGELDENATEVAKKMSEYVKNNRNKYVVTAQEKAAIARQQTKDAIDEQISILQQQLDEGYDVKIPLRIYIAARDETQYYDYVNDSDWWKTHTHGDIGHYTGADKIPHNARGGLIDKTQLSWLAEDGPEMVIPLDGSRRAFELWETASRFMNMSLLDGIGGTAKSDSAMQGSGVSSPGSSDNLFEGLNVTNNGRGETRIEYSPVLQFYGEAPSRDDLDDALKMSQDRFDEMMERYLKQNARLAF